MITVSTRLDMAESWSQEAAEEYANDSRCAGYSTEVRVQPRVDEMLIARAQLDEHLNKVLVLLCPNFTAPILAADSGRLGGDLIKHHVAAAKRALDKFAGAAHGA